MELKKTVECLKKALQGKKLVQLAFFLGMGGILLIYLSTLASPREEPQREEPVSDTAEAYQKRLEQDLTRVVKAVTGEEAPEVMITLKDAGSSVYAADSRQNGEEAGNTHVILEDAQGAQNGLRLADQQPEVRGVVIVSRGAADPVVREKLVNAARAVLGLPASRVCVLESRAG